MRVWWEQSGGSGGVKHPSGVGTRENGRARSHDGKCDKCGEGGKFPFPLGCFWLAEQSNQQGADWQEKIKFNVMCVETPHARESQRPCPEKRFWDRKGTEVHKTHWAREELMPPGGFPGSSQDGNSTCLVNESLPCRRGGSERDCDYLFHR